MYPAILTQVARSPRKRLAGLLVVPVLFLAGCANNTETGALVGAGAGGLTGAVIGSALHRPGLGAAIGAGAGALTGAAIGNAEDKKEAKQEAQAVAASAQAQMQGLTDVATMARRHEPDDIIINQIRTSPVVYHLSAEQIDWLRNNGVSDPVIRELQQTAMRLPRRVYVEGAVYQPSPVVVVEEPPPVAVGVGFGYRRRW
jgi:hypothetical protein